MSDKTKEDKQEDKSLSKLIIVIAVVIVGVLILNWIWASQYEVSARGVFGDLFGFSNAIFSGLALAGVIISLRLQSNELGLQREELRETREELKRSAEAQEKSEKQLQIQAESMKLTARLNALNTLIKINNERIERLDRTHRKSLISKLNTEIRMYEEEIGEILLDLKEL